jgi:glycosyltransferase involved in cell wall biosynthesis
MSARGERTRVLFLVSEDWFFAVHFLERALAIRAAGFDVAVATRVRAQGERIRDAGIELFPLELARRGKNPLTEFGTVRDIAAIYRAYRPHLVHHIAMKPILYGSTAARWCGVPAVVNELTGMGFLFTSTDVVRRVVRQPMWLAYRTSLRTGRTIVQNRDDLALLVRKNIVDPARASIVYGAGVDTTRFAPSPEAPGDPLVVLPARMLTDKGVGEFVAAGRILRDQGVQVRLALVGTPDPANPAAIPEAQLRAWVGEGVVEWWGWRDDMLAVYAAAHVVCLPSYREGLPRSLIEGAACGRPIVTTDVPGCREAVVDGTTGLLVPAEDGAALAEAIQRMVSDPALRHRMGAAGRQLALAKFGVDRVVADTLDVYDAALAGRSRPQGAMSRAG